MAKQNPRRRPATQADVEKAKNQATQEAVRNCWIIMFSVLRDKRGFHGEDLKEIWDGVESLSQSVVQKYCSIPDLRKALLDEEGINIK